MIKSLKSVVEPKKLALQSIPLLAKTDRGCQMTYVIVESEYDQLIFNKFFDLQKVHIFTSSMSEKNFQESCTCVEDIVNLITQSTNVTLFGIRDADYTTFDTTYSLPLNVFRTDARDIEMMMFDCGEVRTELTKQNGFDNFFSKSISIAREIGLFRIVNDVNKRGFNFRKNIKYDKLLDSRSGDLMPGALDAFGQAFFEHKPTYSNLDFDAFKNVTSNTPDNLLCRGHDVITLLANYLEKNITKKEIELTLAVYYAFTSFQQSALYSSVLQWGSVSNKTLFRS